MSVSSQNLYNTSGIRVKKDAFVVIVRTEWNDEIVSKLEAGCVKVLEENKAAYKIIVVPGAFEIPFGIKSYWDAQHGYKPDAFIALGCVLRGDTPHFDYVCKAVTDGVMQLNLQLPAPSIFGVLTIDNQQQADERTGGKHGHKGEEAAITALKMMSLVENF